MIASHFAAPLERAVSQPTVLRAAASEEAEAVGQVGPGEPFWLLEDSLGWSWGYAGSERRVGYVRSEAVAKP